MGCNKGIPLDSASCYPRSRAGLVVNQGKHTYTPTIPISLSFISLFSGLQESYALVVKSPAVKSSMSLVRQILWLSTWRQFETTQATKYRNGSDLWLVMIKMVKVNNLYLNSLLVSMVTELTDPLTFCIYFLFYGNFRCTTKSKGISRTNRMEKIYFHKKRLKCIPSNWKILNQ